MRLITTTYYCDCPSLRRGAIGWPENFFTKSNSNWLLTYQEQRPALTLKIIGP